MLVGEADGAVQLDAAVADRHRRRPRLGFGRRGQPVCVGIVPVAEASRLVDQRAGRLHLHEIVSRTVL